MLTNKRETAANGAGVVLPEHCVITSCENQLQCSAFLDCKGCVHAERMKKSQNVS
ncbi:hypothetical protein CHCC5025_0810 [Bacillus licheniformis]|nr:hypothetical protein CHCC5025_0810 [Bacillus licheniformis]TWJ85051.1 hypothetical protein CHCC20496_1356 [Bacillus licheniformis]TWK52155.1 hypothetical protein CHCC20345_0359 [Bacillus licheniformis]